MSNLPANNDDHDKSGDRRIVHTEISRSFSGPLPLPEILGKYDEIVHGAAARIRKMAKYQFAHRVEIKKKVINADINRSKWGQILGFIISIAGIGASLALGLNDQETVASVIGGGTLASLVSVFMYGSKTRHKEREDKAQSTEK